MHQTNLPGADDEVMVWSCDVDATVLERIAVRGMDGGEPSGARENLRKHASDLRHVHHDENRGAEIARQVSYDGADSFNAASRGADDDDIVSGHGGVRASFMPHWGRRSQADYSTLTLADIRIIINGSTEQPLNPRHLRNRGLLWEHFII